MFWLWNYGMDPMYNIIFYALKFYIFAKDLSKMLLYISSLALHKQAQWRACFTEIAVCFYHPCTEMKL